MLFCDHPQPFANVNCENVLMSHPINSLSYIWSAYTHSNDSTTCLNGTCVRGHSSGIVYFEFNSKLKQSKAKGLWCPIRPSVLFKEWSIDQQHQYHRGLFRNPDTQGRPPHTHTHLVSQKPWDGTQQSVFNKHSKRFWSLEYEYYYYKAIQQEGMRKKKIQSK